MKLPINYTARVEHVGQVLLDPADYIQYETEEEVIWAVKQACATDSDIEHEEWDIDEDDMLELVDFLEMWQELKESSTDD